MDAGKIVFDVATWLVPLVIAIVLHEISHGWVANALGDPTAKERGRLSPNPIRHVDPVGTVILPLALAVAGAPVFGWAKPVPVIAKRLRNPRVHMMIVALAGPGMNLLLALLAAIGLAAVVPGAKAGSAAMLFVGQNLANFLTINLFLAIFNLLPIPPFDGSHVVEGLLPRRAASRYRRLGRYGFPLMLFLLVLLPAVAPDANVVAEIVVPPVLAIRDFLFGLAGIA